MRIALRAPTVTAAPRLVCERSERSHLAPTAVPTHGADLWNSCSTARRHVPPVRDRLGWYRLTVPRGHRDDRLEAQRSASTAITGVGDAGGRRRGASGVRDPDAGDATRAGRVVPAALRGVRCARLPPASQRAPARYRRVRLVLDPVRRIRYQVGRADRHATPGQDSSPARL